MVDFNRAKELLHKPNNKAVLSNIKVNSFDELVESIKQGYSLHTGNPSKDYALTKILRTF